MDFIFWLTLYICRNGPNRSYLYRHIPYLRVFYDEIRYFIRPNKQTGKVLNQAQVTQINAQNNNFKVLYNNTANNVSLPVLLTSLRKTRGTSPLLHGSYTPQYDPPRSSTNSPQSSSTSESPEDFLESWLSGRSPSGEDRKRTSAVTTFAQTFDVCKATNGMPPSPLRTRHSLGPQCSRSDRTWSTCTFDTAS